MATIPRSIVLRRRTRGWREQLTAITIALVVGRACASCSAADRLEHSRTDDTPCLRVTSRTVCTNSPPFYNAIYAEPRGPRLLGPGTLSEDNGQTWLPFSFNPDFNKGRSYGYRRVQVTSACDRRTGRLITVFNALDTPGLDPKAHEPPIAQQTYYLRYRVSEDGGRSWRFDTPIIQKGAFDAKHPVEGVWLGKNAIYLGDLGCIPLVTRKGKILLPTQMTPLARDGTLWNPKGGWTFTDVLVLSGTWTAQGSLEWTASKPLRGDPERTTRGLIEPTLAEFPGGRILMVMRGSNGGKADSQHRLPSYKWAAVSRNEGRSWSKPEPWTYDNGLPFFSPSSMSTLFTHSSGRCFWAGNISSTNCAGNLPRWPLVIGEVDPKNLRLIHRTLLIVDTEQPGDKAQGRLDISHLTMFEDRQSREIVLTYPRAHNAYRSREWVTVRLTPK